MCSFHTYIWGQQFKIHPDSSFYHFLDSFYFYNQDDSAEGGIFNQVRRDKITWGTRLAPSGNMSKATQARMAYAQNYSPQSSSGTGRTNGLHPSNPTWNELGPIKPVQRKYGGYGMGQIHRLAFHPSFGLGGNQTMYAGSHYGGLYRSDNAGQDWYNYHTDRGLPITSIGGVAVSQNKVFVCTGNGDHGYDNYGLQGLPSSWRY